MVTAHQVHLRKDGGAGQVGGEVLYVQHWVPVGGGGVVQATEITTGKPTAISLGHHVQGGGPRTVGTAHDAEALHGGELLPGDHKLGRVEVPGPCIDLGANCGDVVLHTMFSHCR